MLTFRIVFVSVMTSLFAYLGRGLLQPLPDEVRLWGWALLFIPYAAILWMPLVFWQKKSDETTPLERAGLMTAFGGMGILSFTLLLVVARDLAELASRWIPGLEQASHWARGAEASGLILLVSLAAFALGVVLAHSGVALREVRVTLPGLAPGLRGLRILQISDLHVGPTLRRAFVEKVARISREASPDVIVLTGDLADGSVADLREEIAPLGTLRAPLGQYYVPGNHEYYWDPQGWFAELERLGYAGLLNRGVTLERGGAALYLAGVTDPAAAIAGLEGPDFARALAGTPSGAPRILLCHQPKFASRAAAAGAQLQLSGHTHGGQFAPWTWIAGLVHKFNYGLHREGEMWIYVSRGTGYWGPPVRLGSPAEVTLIVLK